LRKGNPTALFAGEGKIGRGLGNRLGRSTLVALRALR
jgi:hypothetical protein